jgi:hypothetical protein
MAGIIPAPVLGPSGWTTALREKADYLLSWAFTTDNLQSNLYADALTSIPAVVQEYAHDIPRLTIEMRSMFESYFGRYYDSCLVNVSSDANSTTNPGTKVTLRVGIEVIEQGVTYQLARLVNIADSKITNIINLNNNGNGDS